MSTEIARVVKCENFCGEAPIWNGETGVLHWVDTGKKECGYLDTAGKRSGAIEMEGFPQALGFRKNGGWICPMEDRVVLLDSSFRIEKDLGSPLPPDSSLLIGDGTVGPDGCYYFGVYHPEELTSKEGGVYRVNRDLSFEKVIGGMALPNGMAFSEEGDLFYLTEMFARRIWRFRFDTAKGVFSDKELFTEIPEDEGYPDGLILDREGGVWSAHWQGFRVTRYDREGRSASVLPVPVPTATCMSFDGEGRLYITTARKGCSEEQLKSYPESGSLFSVKTATGGLCERVFKED